VTKGILVVESAILADFSSANSQIKDYGGPVHELRFVGNEPGVEDLKIGSSPPLVA